MAEWLAAETRFSPVQCGAIICQCHDYLCTRFNFRLFLGQAIAFNGIRSCYDQYINVYIGLLACLIQLYLRDDGQSFVRPLFCCFAIITLLTVIHQNAEPTVGRPR